MPVAPRTPYGSLLEHHLRIGDTAFFVPPTAISIHRQMKNERVKILRARNSLPKESGYFDRVIEITLFFPDKDNMNEELRPLLSQIKKCPFLPIENTYLNDIHKVDAVTVSGVTVQTTPGFPQTLQAQIQLYSFEPYSYIADDEDRTYDEMFDWPLFRWHYQRNLNPQNAKSFRTYYEPLYKELDHNFKFRIAAEDDLVYMKKWSNDKKKMLKKYVEGKKEDFWGAEELEKQFNKDIDATYEKAMFEYDVGYEEWDIPNLTLTDLSVGFENTITSVQLQHDESPTHQYMGSQDTIIMARFTTHDMESIASLESLIRRSSYLIRTYHKQMANGFLEFDSQLARLFGIKNVTIEDMQTNTVQGMPGAFEVTLTMIAYNRAERKMNEVKWLSETAKWDINQYENQGALSLLTSLNPATMFEDGIGDNPLNRWAQFIGDRPALKEAWTGLKSFLGGSNIQADAVKQAVYEEGIRKFFAAAEVYPDLELPTYGEVEEAGFKVENYNNGVFVDPDFFIKYKKGTLFFEDLVNSAQQNYQTVLRDGKGGEASINGGNIENINDITSEELKNSRKDYEDAVGKNKVSYSAIPEELIDKNNLSVAQAEALIREKSQQFNINQNFTVAFAKALDSELKQFYDVGTNTKQDKVVNSKTSSPTMMNKNFKYYVNNDGSIDGEYIGIMKVRKMYGSNVNLLGKNIEYNVEQGVRKMSQYYTELTQMLAKSNTSDKKVYHEENVYSCFGLNANNSWDQQKARFAGVVMLYLGYDREYVDLLKDNKQPPREVIDIINKVLNSSSNNQEWSNQTIKEKTKGLPVKDFKTTGPNAKRPEQNMKESDFTDDNRIHTGMLHDMVKYDMRGRLVRAFPTFFLTFIDEGKYMGTVKMSDQFFSYQAVMDITYTNSRKEASSTLAIEMCNIYGTLDDAEKDMDLTNTGMGEVFKMLTMPGAVAKEAERSRHRNANYYKSIMLRTGTRIHFRMGYGSNPMSMPTIMNGTITSIQNNGISLTVIAQDDGIELTNKIRADVNETTDGGFLFSKQEPTEIVDELLTDSKGFFANLWAGLSNDEFQEHSLGIMHFGHQQAPQGWGELGGFFGGAAVGASGGFLIGGPIGAAIGGVAGGFIGGATFGKDSRTVGEINMNIYQTTGLTNEEHDGWWNKVKDAFGIGQADEPGINIGLFDKTVWDVLNICAAVGDDHIVAVHPFGFRNTIFSGKPYFPLHYDYVVDGEEVKGTALKPFRQFHVYDSATSIIDNSIETTEDNMYTVAVGVYMNEGEMDTTSPVFVDTNIWPEKQRVVNIDTTMNAQGVRMIQNIPLIGGLLNKLPKWYYDEGVAVKITAAGLRDYVKDMYDGYLTVMGDPSVKPFDQMWINDEFNSMAGPAEVKEVTQIMNHEQGYVTLIKPDVVVVNTDRRAMTLLASAQALAGSALITHTLRKKLRTSKYAGHLPIMNALWSSTKNRFDKMKERFNTSKLGQKFQDKVTGGKAPNGKEIAAADELRKGGISSKDIARWSKNGLLEQLAKLTGEEGSNNLKNIFQNSKEFGYNSFKNVKMKAKGSALIAKGSKSIGKVLKGGRGVVTALWTGAHIMAGPVGWLGLAIEALGVHIISSTIGEFIERWLFMRQACLISPLHKSGLEYTAGINGHKGSVVGDAPDIWKRLMTNDVSAFILGFIGVDAWQFRNDDLEDQMGMKSDGPTEQPIDLNKMASSFYNAFRKQIPTLEKLGELYDKDRKAALEQINKRLELLGKRETKAAYEEEKTTWEDWKNKIKNKITGWFKDLWDKVTSFFGNKDDGTCVPEGDVPTDGKAKGLSKYFDVIGPKIEAEAKAQGIGSYAEILKSLTMQESGGNYHKLPDVMQSSESMGKPIGYIKDVDASIKQGVTHFKNQLARAKGDIKLVLQSYNFGGGFIDYCMNKGGKYTYELAYSFSESMVKKVGRISRIPPGYGDSKYVERVLRYYDGNLPAGACKGGGAVGEGSGGASSCPVATGREGKSKYHLGSGGAPDIIDLHSLPGRNFGLTIVGGGGTSKVRKATGELLIEVAKLYKAATGDSFNITSGWRPGDNQWHGTGWAADIDTPNTMRVINGKMRFPNGTDKEKARKLVECCLKAGFRGLVFGDWDIIQEMNGKYGDGAMQYDPKGHWNHLHCSYPLCRK